LFKKAALFTDLHLGLKSNSITHNRDCEQFIDWYIKTAKENECDTGIFMGDWHNSRASINVQTLNYSLRALEKLANAFSQFFFITGNHDLYYKDKRDVHSIEFARNIKGITLVNDVLNVGDCSFVPWVVGNEYKKLKKTKARYMFGHFELPHFYMNAMVQMPDTGTIKHSDLKGPEYVFSGHFHKRQQQNNIVYIGNAFPHNYADTWDDERGLAILEWGGEPSYIAWPDAPKFRKLNLSQLLENPKANLQNKTYARVIMDIDISYEEATFIKEQFMDEYNLRELSLIVANQDEHTIDYEPGEINFESVDQIVISQLKSIDSTSYDPNVLISIYNRL